MTMMDAATDIQIIAMSEQEAQAWKDRVGNAAQSLRVILYEGYSRSVWIALGYSNWSECVRAIATEFQFSEDYIWKLHKANQTENNLLDQGLVGTIPERHLRPLASLEPPQQREAWAIATNTAPNGKVTASHVEMVVASMKAPELIYERTNQGNGIVKCSSCNKLYDGSALEFCPYCAYTPNQRRQYLQHEQDRRKSIDVDSSPEKYQHVSDDSYEWYTPDKYIEAARQVMGGIDLDPASCDEAQEKIKAKKYYTKKDDGLIREWHGRVWLNPPYCMPEIEQFTDRTIDLHKKRKISHAVVLTNNSTDTAWFHKLLIYSGVACFTKGRVKFWGPDGSAANGARQGQVLFYIGDNTDKFIEEFRHFGAIVRAI